MLDLGWDICRDLDDSGRREWLVTNGVGGYAAGTVAGLLTRRYHGLLVAALRPPVGRRVLVSKLDETVRYRSQSFSLSTNRWADGRVEPQGFQHLERFRLEGTTPVWTFACADALLEKRIWMEQRANTTYVRYDLVRGVAPLALAAQVLVTYRDHHGNTRADDWQQPMGIRTVSRGLEVIASDGATPFYVLSDKAAVSLIHDWHLGFSLPVEMCRGLDDREDLLHAGNIATTLLPGQSCTIVASTESRPALDGSNTYVKKQRYEASLLNSSGPKVADPEVAQLVLAADQFVVRRPLSDSAGSQAGHSVIAGYPWFGDWGRDTMISLPGLALSTGRPEIAASILRTFAHYVDQGMLPNRFPDAGTQPEYNTVDATLWYFEAIRAYYSATKDDALVRDLFPVLEDIIAWHLRGTRYQIRVDDSDGLLHAGEPGVQLTWMDAKVDDWVVTPRIGKPVEVNALWYNALCIMAALAERLGAPSAPYSALATQAASGFARFWNECAGFCYDLIDGPEGDDPALRPNQLFAVALPYSPLREDQQRLVVDVCASSLLTSHGLRSLAPTHPNYTGSYGGDRRQRDAAYHQGTVWGWLIGPFVQAHLRVYRDSSKAWSYLRPLFRHLTEHGVGTISEVFDGDSPHRARGCFAQAWSVAELLRLVDLLASSDAGNRTPEPFA